jgi:hypothetical protein
MSSAGFRSRGSQEALTFDTTTGRQDRFHEGLNFISRWSSCSIQAPQR